MFIFMGMKKGSSSIHRCLPVDLALLSIEPVFGLDLKRKAYYVYWVMESTLHYAVCIFHAILSILLYQHTHAHAYLSLSTPDYVTCANDILVVKQSWSGSLWLFLLVILVTCKSNTPVETLDPFGGFLGLSDHYWGNRAVAYMRRTTRDLFSCDSDGLVWM